VSRGELRGGKEGGGDIQRGRREILGSLKETPEFAVLLCQRLKKPRRLGEKKGVQPAEREGTAAAQGSSNVATVARPRSLRTGSASREEETSCPKKEEWEPQGEITSSVGATPAENRCARR